MNNYKNFDHIFNVTPNDTKRFVDKSMSILDRIHYLINEQGISQKN